VPEITYLELLRSVRQPAAVRQALELMQRYGSNCPAWHVDVDHVVEIEVLATQNQEATESLGLGL
jgi:hypothetical protein